MLRTAKGFALDALGRYEDALKAFESAGNFRETDKSPVPEKALFLCTAENGKKP